MARHEPGPVLPLVLLGAGVLLLSGMVDRPVAQAVQPPRSRRFRAIYHGIVTALDVLPEQVVRIIPADEGDRRALTSLRLHVGGHSAEHLLMEPPWRVADALGMGEQLLKVHAPLGYTDPRTGPEWEEEPSMELTPIWINKSHIEMIGPSPWLHYRRRQLGKVYTRDGLDLELYESLSLLRDLVGPDVPEITEKFRPRPTK